MLEPCRHPYRAIRRHQPAPPGGRDLHRAFGGVHQLRLAVHVSVEPHAFLVVVCNQMNAVAGRGPASLNRGNWLFGDIHWPHPVSACPYNLFRLLQESFMNNPVRVIGFVNAGHFIDHYSMLIFAAAVIIMGPALGMAYSELLPYATPGFIAFGAGSLVTGWLGDRWSRRHMMLIFFAGIGLSMIAVGLVSSPLQLGLALLSIGLFASIYHPVGTAMIVSYAEALGREMGINGVWGNLGVASSALVTGVVGQYLGWRWAFILPGIVTILIGLCFMAMVSHEDRSNVKQAAAQARVAKKDMWRVIVALLIVVIAISTTFNAVAVALPKLFAERLPPLPTRPGPPRRGAASGSRGGA